MVTRLYLPSSGTAPISPAVSTSWEESASTFFRAPTLTTKANAALTNFGPASLTQATGQSCFAQWVSPPLDSDQTISSGGAATCSIVQRGLQNANGDNMYLAFALRVVSNDGSVVRGTLKFQGTNTGGVEYATAARTRIWSALAMTEVNALAGDRIVIEIGMHRQAPTVVPQGTMRFGDPTAVADFALTDGLTTDLCSWIETSQTITFGSETLTGSGAGSAKRAQGSATGGLELAGTGAGAAPHARGSGAGVETIDGAGSGNALRPQGLGAGAEEIPGVGAGAAPRAQGAGTGALEISAAGAGNAPRTQGAGAGAEELFGTAAGAAPHPQGLGAGSVDFGGPPPPISGSGAGDARRPRGAGAGGLELAGVGAGRAPRARGTGAGSVLVTTGPRSIPRARLEGRVSTSVRLDRWPPRTGPGP